MFSLRAPTSEIHTLEILVGDKIEPSGILNTSNYAVNNSCHIHKRTKRNRGDTKQISNDVM